MKLNRAYSIAFGASLVVMLIFAWLLNDSIKSLNDRSFWENRSHVILEQLSRLNIAMTDIETSQRGFLLASDSTLLNLLYISRSKVPVLLDTITALTGDTQEQQRNVNLLRDAVVRRLQKGQEVLNRAPYLHPGQMKEDLVTGDRLMDDFRLRMAAVANHEQSILKSRSQSRHIYENLTPAYFRSIFIIATLIAVLTFILLMNESRERQKTQALLELRIESLNRVNSELQQIANVTSHDLQEPLRKIRTFSDMLVFKFGPTLPSEARDTLERVGKNANAIRELVSDLSSFAELANTAEQKNDQIDLNKILLDIQKELNSTIADNKVKFFISTLPVIPGYQKQLYILFKELIGNSIKFRQENVAPEIWITGNLLAKDQVKKGFNFGNRDFVVVSVYDNGIGFDNEFGHKIFILFQKLHGHESPYPGKGIGLSVCQRIISNHDGFIEGSGEVGKGAKIQLYFPLN